MLNIQLVDKYISVDLRQVCAFPPLFATFIDLSYLDNYCSLLPDLPNLAFAPLQSILGLVAWKIILNSVEHIISRLNTLQ